MSKSPTKRKDVFNDSGLGVSSESSSSSDEDEDDGKDEDSDSNSTTDSSDDSEYCPDEIDNEIAVGPNSTGSAEVDKSEYDGEELTRKENDVTSTPPPQLTTDQSNDVKSDYKAKDRTVWTTKPPVQRRTAAENIPRFDDPGPSGLASNSGLSAVELFRLFLDREMLEEIVKYTNEFASTQIEQQNQAYPPDKKSNWSPVDVIELEAFIGLLLLAGVEKSKRQPVRELWNSDLRIGRPAFKATMARDRFSTIMKFLRFRSRSSRQAQAQKRQRQPHNNHSKVGPIEELFARFNSNLGKYYTPGVYLTVDEMLLKFRGKACFRVYMKSKPGKYGIKIWVVVDAETGYILKIQIYQGKMGGVTEKDQGKRVVLDLTEPYLDCGRGITADNFFTSKDLALELLQRKTTYVGTIRKNRLEVPSELVDPRGREDLSSIFVFNDKLTLVSYVPKKGRTVLLLSSEHHSPKIEITGKMKPEIILHYNSTKGGVDTVDQMVNHYSCQRQSNRWPIKVFYALLDMTALNSFIIWKHHHHKSATAKELTRRTFIRELCFELVKANMSRRASVNLQYPIRTAMSVMGVDEPRPPRPPKPPEGVPGRIQWKPGKCKCGRSSRTKCDNCYRFACQSHKRVTHVCLECVAKEPKIKPSNLHLDEEYDSEGCVIPLQPSEPEPPSRLRSIRSKSQGKSEATVHGPGLPPSPLMPVLEPEESCQEKIGRKDDFLSDPIQLLLPSAASTPIPIRISEPNMPTFGYSIVFDLAEVQNATGEVVESGHIALPSTVQQNELLPAATMETEANRNSSITWESAGGFCSDIVENQMELHREQVGSMEIVPITKCSCRKRPSTDDDQVQSEIPVVHPSDFYSKLLSAPENEFTMFGLSIAPKLQRISVMDRRKAAELQLQIYTLLTKHELKLDKAKDDS